MPVSATSTLVRAYMGDARAIETVFRQALGQLRRYDGSGRCFASKEERFTWRVRHDPDWTGPDPQPGNWWSRINQIALG
jgi:hypothetical protein